MPSPRLDILTDPPKARGVVLFLHGGQQSSTEVVRDRHASWWRMARMAAALRRQGAADLKIALLQYRLRGWNDPQDPAPVRDARWALEQLGEDGATAPIMLVGHSMGGRTACRAADASNVAGVVALAPWLPDGEPVEPVRDRSLHVLHGTRDRWTSAGASRRYVERARAVARETTWEPMEGAGHYMLRRISRWNGFVEDSVQRVLLSHGDPSEDERAEGHA